MRASIEKALVAVLLLICAGCAATDQFSSRIYSGNVNSQTALDQETLLNIVRASRYQPLTFVAVTKIAGQQTGDFKVGLPTFTLGPAQTAMQRQFTFSNNSLDTSVQGSFESNPLISSVFQQGMMTPLPPRLIALLLSSYPREQVFFAAVDGIKATSSRGAYYFSNDPLSNALRGQPTSPECLALEVVSPRGKSHGEAVAAIRPDNNRDCNFSQFTYLMEYAIASGLSAEFDRSAAGVATKLVEGEVSKTNNALSTPAPPGYLCFDPTLARPDLRADALTAVNKCSPNGAKRGLTVKFQFGDTLYDLEFRMRSPLGIYAYLGRLLRSGDAGWVRFQDPTTGQTTPTQLVSITDTTVGCLSATGAAAGLVCNTDVSTQNTLIMIGMLQQLRNIMISPSDLNSSFSVRLGF